MQFTISVANQYLQILQIHTHTKNHNILVNLRLIVND